jgi:hypothetical protein
MLSCILGFRSGHFLRWFSTKILYVLLSALVNGLPKTCSSGTRVSRVMVCRGPVDGQSVFERSLLMCSLSVNYVSDDSVLGPLRAHLGCSSGLQTIKSPDEKEVFSADFSPADSVCVYVCVCTRTLSNPYTTIVHMVVCCWGTDSLLVGISHTYIESVCCVISRFFFGLWGPKAILLY